MRAGGPRGVVHAQAGDVLDQVDDFGDVGLGGIRGAGDGGFEAFV